MYSGYDDTGENNRQYNLPRYTMHNESPIVIEDDVDDDNDSSSDIRNSGIKDVRNKILYKLTPIKVPEYTITVSGDLEDDSGSDIEIFEPLMKLKRNIVHGVTKNTNLFTRHKENNSLNVKTFFIPKHNTSLVKSNQLEEVSTAKVNRLKTTTTRLQSKSSSNTEIGLIKSILKPKQQLKNTSSKESISEVSNCHQNMSSSPINFTNNSETRISQVLFFGIIFS